VRAGDTVIVERAGDVIPAIVRVLPSLRKKGVLEFRMPKKCPVCGSSVLRAEGEVVHRCTNVQCGAVRRENIYHFGSTKAFSTEGLGPQLIDQLMDAGLISDASDIFLLTEGDLVPLQRFAEKSASNLVQSIRERKKVPLARFIYALGIHHVGEETAVDLAGRFSSLEALASAPEEELKKVHDIGDVVAKSIYAWLHSPRNTAFLKKLERAGVTPIKPKRERGAVKFRNLTFVLTGELKSMTRDEVKEVIRSRGGDVSSSVSQNTDYVVAGEHPGSKFEKARKLGIKIIDENKFRGMLK